MKKKYLIVIANYYKDISRGLLKSATDLFPKSTFIKVINVPGVFEIPVTIAKNIKKPPIKQENIKFQARAMQLDS